MFRDKLKSLFNKETESENSNNKKKVENLVVFLILLIITIIAINIIWNGDKNVKEQNNNDTSKKLANSNVSTNITNNKDINSDNQTSEIDLTQSLENILSKIKGVGDVKVFINYSESNEIVPMYNENSKISNTEETDTSGGKRKIEQTDSQKEIIYQENDGEKTPITKKVVEPKIEGAIITAKGANDPTIKTSIIQAVEAATGLATHKIQVFEMN